MALRTRVEPVDDWIKSAVAETLSPPARSKEIALYARKEIAEVASARGLAIPIVLGAAFLAARALLRIFVDGREGAALETVKPGGTIVAEFDLIGDVLRWIGETLLERSPVVSGRYRSGHTLSADGRPASLAGPFPPAKEYVFLNAVPYARKIEIGKTKAGRAFVIQVPNRIYERTAADAARRFGNTATVSFEFRSSPGALSRLSRRESRAPAIIVRPL